MANKKNKKQQPTKKKVKQPPTRPAPRRDQPNLSYVRDICAVTNPFCDEAIGSKWPDNSFTKSVPVTYKTNSVFTTSGDGKLSYLNYVNDVPFISAGVPDGSTPSTFNFATGISFPGVPVVSGIVRRRLTSIGYKISCAGSRMTTQGMLHLRLFSPLTANALAGIDGTTMSADKIMDVPLSRLIDRDIYVVLSPLGINARTFLTPINAPTQPLMQWENPGWQVLLLTVLGAADVTPLSVTVYSHYEYVYEDSNSNQLFATAAPANNIAVREGSASVIERIGGFVESTNKAIDTLTRSTALRYIAGYALPGVSRASQLLLH